MRWCGREHVSQAARRRIIGVRRLVEDETDAASFLGIDDGVGGAPRRCFDDAVRVRTLLCNVRLRGIDEMLNFTLKVAAIVHLM